MDAKTRDSSRAVVLLHCIMPASPTPASKDKHEVKGTGEEKEVQQEG